MAGGKPEIKVFFKRADGSGYVDLCAFWRNDRGMLSGKLDRNIRAIKIVREDGTEEVIRPSEKGYVDGMFLNCRVWSEDPPARQQRQPRREAPPADDFDDSDLPF